MNRLLTPVWMVSALGGEHPLEHLVDVNQAVEAVGELEGLAAYMWLYMSRYEESKLTTPQRELLYDILDSRRESGQEPYRRWWQEKEKEQESEVSEP